MDLQRAMKERHTVRKYKSRKLPVGIVDQLNSRVAEHNRQYGLNIQLVVENTEAFTALIKLTLAKNIRNYFVMAGPDTSDVEEMLGFCGADLMLFSQTLGLNTWWVGATFSRRGARKNGGIPEAQKLIGVMAVGYGATQGVQHKSRKAFEVADYAGDEPQWFRDGVTAALLAPTARNRQTFKIEGRGNKVKMTCENGAFSNTDLGLVKYHFELGAGKENFEWE